jgi:Ser/Thr protein kinase RdoA (MazF antagonist)
MDAHPGNVFVTDDCELTLFDFDDASYGHFVYDIAMVLFYVSLWDKDATSFTARFMPPFLQAYREENRLDPRWLRELPVFLKLREIDLFWLIHLGFPDGSWENDDWCCGYMDGRRERIEAGTPFISYDWRSLERHLQ